MTAYILAVIPGFPAGYPAPPWGPFLEALQRTYPTQVLEAPPHPLSMLRAWFWRRRGNRFRQAFRAWKRRQAVPAFRLPASLAATGIRLVINLGSPGWGLALRRLAPGVPHLYMEWPPEHKPVSSAPAMAARYRQECELWVSPLPVPAEPPPEGASRQLRVPLLPSVAELAPEHQNLPPAGEPGVHRPYHVDYVGDRPDQLDWPLIRRLAARSPEITYRIFGPLRRLSRDTRAALAQPNVRWLGALPTGKLAQLLQESDAYWFPLRADLHQTQPYPAVASLALAQARPLLSAPVPVLAPLQAEGILKFVAGDAFKWRTALRNQLAHDSSRLRQARLEARRRVAPSPVVESLMEQVERLLSARPPAAEH